jgi:hypothetical protein
MYTAKHKHFNERGVRKALKGNSLSHHIQSPTLWPHCVMVNIEHKFNHYTMTFSRQKPILKQVKRSISSVVCTLPLLTNNGFWSMISFTLDSVKNVQCHLYFLYTLHVTKKLLFRCRLLFSDYRHHTIRFPYVMCATKS